MNERVRFGDDRRVIVCVDTYDDSVFAGRFYDPMSAEGITFQSLIQFLREMERNLDETDGPRSFTTMRSFGPPTQRMMDSPEVCRRKGEKATFEIRILFRQNASWQGALVWMEGGQEQSFRSVLELILLMDSALSQKE